MSTTIVERAARRIERHERALTDLRNTAPKPPGHDARPEFENPADPLDGFSPEQIEDLIDDLLEDWEHPELTELGLCRAHNLSLRQILAISRLPRFQETLALMREIRESRRERVHAASVGRAVQALTAVAADRPRNATHAKEIRLAARLLIQLTAPDTAGPASSRPPLPNTHDEPSNRGVP